MVATYVRYLIRRFFVYLLIWFVANSLVFLLPRLLPINVANIIVGRLESAAIGSSGQYSPQALQKLYNFVYHYFGLNQPLYIQFIDYWKGIFQGNFGISAWLFPEPVSKILSGIVFYDIALLVPAIFLGFWVGNKLGAIAAFNKHVDRVLMPILYFIAYSPYYWFALLLITVFTFYLKLLPSTFTSEYTFTMPTLTWGFVSTFLKEWILPFLSVFLVSIGQWAIGMRANIVSELGSNYITYAESLGIKYDIIRNYAYRNASLPQYSGLAINLGLIFVSAGAVEFIFMYPGMGWVIWNAITNLDYFLMEGALFYVITMVVIANFLIEIVYVIIDPRVRVGTYA